MLGILRSLATTVSTALRKPVTTQYPTEMRRLAPRSRGLPLLVWDHEHDEPFCIGCKQCADICPVDCISVAGPVDNPRAAPRDHDLEACQAANGGVCPHSPRRTLPALSFDDSWRFMIDEDRCMRCGLCEWVCPTDQERYGNQKAIVNGTGYISIQSSVYDRNDNILDLDGLTYHSRVLRLELNAVMGTKTPEQDIAVNNEAVAGIRLSSGGGDLPVVESRPPSGLSMRVKRLLLRAYAPFWLKKRGLPLRPERLEEARPHSDSDSWPSFREAAGRGRRR